MVEYVGLDVSKEETSYCVVEEKGAVLARGKVSSDPDGIFAALKEHCLCPEQIVLETGTLSHWLGRGLRERGLRVELIDARQAHAVMRLQHNKTDANDAALLAELARTGFYRSVAVKSEAAQLGRVLLKARSHLVGQWRSRQNAVRGLLGTLGIRLPKGTGKFVARVRVVLAERPELSAIFAPLVDELVVMKRNIERLTQQVKAAAKGDPVCRRLMTAPGVGPITALAFAATIDDPSRFGKSRAVGPYLGLTSRRYQSGEMDYSGRISKMGDALLRSLLYGAAVSALTRVRQVRKRTSHKKACVALARKLAVALHKMWVSGEDFAWPQDDAKAKAAA
jgi:transposase